jgi:class 3 adenylate cyclase
MATENIHRMAAILFTDMVGFSHQMQLDEALTMRLLDEHNAIIEARIDTYRGRVIKTVGDAFMAEFPSSLLAVKCALDIQSALDKRNEQVVNDNERIEVRMGVHVGDVHERDGDLFGVTVNVASRLEPLAAPGTLCVSVDVLKQVLNQVHADAEDLGAPDLKGIKTRFPVFRLRPSQDRLKRPRKRAKRIDRGRAIAMLLLVLFAGLLWQQKSRLKAAEPAAQITDKILEVASTNHWGDLKTYNNSASIGMTALYNAMEHIIPFGKKHGPDQLLERFEHDVDYKIWRMKLRTGVFFHPHPCLKDGQTREATGADLLYSLRANSFSEVPSDYAQSMVLGEDDVVTVLLHDSDISFPRRLWTIPLFPRELDGCDEPSDFKQPSATGPWRFTGPLNGTDLTLSRWSKWWNKKSLKGQLPGKMRFHQVPNAAEAIQGVSDGRFDLFQPAGITEPKSIVAQAETVENVTTAHDQLPCTTLEYRLPISGDFRDLLVANTDLAWALTHAIDREKSSRCKTPTRFPGDAFCFLTSSGTTPESATAFLIWTWRVNFTKKPKQGHSRPNSRSA